MRVVSKALAIVAAATALAGTAALPAHAATGADGFTILATRFGQAAHHCEVVGNPDQYGNKAVGCTDLGTYNTFDDANETYLNNVAPQVEALCENSSAVIVQCANIELYGEYADGAADRETYHNLCGHSYGACPTGRLNAYASIWSLDETGTCGANPNSAAQIWNLVMGGYTKIELPKSGVTVTVGANYSSGHYYYCYNPNG